MPLIEKFKVNAPHVQENDENIVSEYTYNFTEVNNLGDVPTFTPKSKNYIFKTEKKVPKLGYIWIWIH